MKAVVHRRYGPPDRLRCEEVERPVPAPDEVLIGVRAASVNPLDWHFMRGIPYPIRLMSGLAKPKSARLGVDAAGVVEAVGPGVTDFAPGDSVFGACRGAFAEYACARASKIALKPRQVTFEQAASLPIAAITALQGLRDKGRLKSGQTVLINGAAGGVGTFAVQIAKSSGALVTGVCSARNLEMVTAIGADRVVDYAKEDFTRRGERYDLLLDCIGNHTVAACRRALKPDGAYVPVGGDAGRWMIGTVRAMLGSVVLSWFVSQKLVTAFVASLNHADLAALGDLVEAGTVHPVIDRTYPFEDAAEALRYLETGHARGKVVISVAA